MPGDIGDDLLLRGLRGHEFVLHLLQPGPLRGQSDAGQVDKADKAYFEKNSQAYIKKLKDLDKSFEKVVKEGKRRTILFKYVFWKRYETEITKNSKATLM